MENLRNILKKVQEWLPKNIAFDKFKVQAAYLLFVIFLAFVGASAASSLMVPALLKLASPVKSTKVVARAPEVKVAEGLNYHQIKKEILGRNVFNATGEYPTEKDREKSAADAKAAFDLNAECNPTSLKIALHGTILMGDRHSVAVVKEQGIEDADIYRVGDLLIGTDNAFVAAIDQNQLIINNSGKKECIYSVGTDEAKMRAMSKSSPGGESSDSNTVTLQASWVEAELGEGFAKILQTARLVPNTEGNKVKGFKIFSIQKETLFDKVGLKDGDIVIQVNDTVLEAEQGFTLYQTFLEEKDIVIHVLREGKTPSTLKVRIR